MLMRPGILCCQPNKENLALLPARRIQTLFINGLKLVNGLLSMLWLERFQAEQYWTVFKRWGPLPLRQKTTLTSSKNIFSTRNPKSIDHTTHLDLIIPQNLKNQMLELVSRMGMLHEKLPKQLNGHSYKKSSKSLSSSKPMYLKGQGFGLRTLANFLNW